MARTSLRCFDPKLPSNLQSRDGRNYKKFVKMRKYLPHVLANQVGFWKNANNNKYNFVFVDLLNASLKNITDFVKSVTREVFWVLIKPYGDEIHKEKAAHNKAIVLCLAINGGCFHQLLHVWVSVIDISEPWRLVLVSGVIQALSNHGEDKDASG